jgi:hypothetical protein
VHHSFEIILRANRRFPSLLPLLPPSLPALPIDTAQHSIAETVEQVKAFMADPIG